jgi:hypothetical protein
MGYECVLIHFHHRYRSNQLMSLSGMVVFLFCSIGGERHFHHWHRSGIVWTMHRYYYPYHCYPCELSFPLSFSLSLFFLSLLQQQQQQQQQQQHVR